MARYGSVLFVLLLQHVANTAIVAQTLPSVARILAPRDLKLPSWNAADLPRGGLRTPSSAPLVPAPATQPVASPAIAGSSSPVAEAPLAAAPEQTGAPVDTIHPQTLPTATVGEQSTADTVGSTTGKATSVAVVGAEGAADDSVA